MSIHLKAIFTYCWREFFSTPLWRYNDDHRGVRAVIWSKSVPIWMSGKQLDPPCFPPPSLYGDLYFWIVSRCFLFFFYHWYAEHAQGLQLTLPSLRHGDITFYFDACSGRQGAFPVQEGAKNTHSERNCKKLLEMYARYNTALMSVALAESTVWGFGTYRRKPGSINCWVVQSRTIVSRDEEVINSL